MRTKLMKVRPMMARPGYVGAVWLSVAALLTALITAVSISPAQAAARVSVGNAQGAPAIDPKYGTTLRLKGSGFQSIKNGYGGIYVFFGTVSGKWRPTQGGQTGRNMMYVPDSETKNNQGYQKFVTYPGSDTASAANGGSIRANGTWSTTINVPGAVFNSRDRNNKVRRVDCRKVQCGIITIGAHGVKNARNETFTPVAVRNLTAAERGTTTRRQTTESGGAAGRTDSRGGGAAGIPNTSSLATRQRGPLNPKLLVDRDTAVAGRVLSFSATGLRPGEQVTATLDDGVVTVGPITTGPEGQLAGALKLPPDLEVGTHVLRLSGGSSGPTVTFPVAQSPDSSSDGSGLSAWLPMASAGVALLVLIGCVIFAVSRMRSASRKESRHGTAIA